MGAWELGPGKWGRDLGKEKGRPARGLQPSREVCITCAVTGAGDTTGRSDKVPVTPRQIADSCIEAAAAGAAIVHIHVREPESGRPARDTALYAEVVDHIRAAGPDVVLNLTAGMGGALTLGRVQDRKSVV